MKNTGKVRNETFGYRYTLPELISAGYKFSYNLEGPLDVYTRNERERAVVDRETGEVLQVYAWQRSLTKKPRGEFYGN